MMFALVIEKDPLRLESVPAEVRTWLVTAGAVAAFALVIWLILRVIRGPSPYRDDRSLSGGQFVGAVAILGLFLMLLPAGLQTIWNLRGWTEPGASAAGSPSPFAQTFAAEQRYAVFPYEGVVFQYGAACALAAVLLPVLGNLRRLSLRRIWALSKLSFKEAVRRRVLIAFLLLMLPIFLFAPWFIDQEKAEYQVRTYVNTVFTAMTALLLITAALLASFSIPADLRSQVIHTVVTKPVERLEIVIGRFIGYMMLMTLMLAIIAGCSLIFVYRNITDEAREQSYKARVPVYGDLKVVGGKNVGYEWEYRQYITVPDRPDEPEYALWTFPTISAELGKRSEPTVRCEFTFDIFRTTKGREEGKGILVSFLFENWKAKPGKLPGTPEQLEAYRREREKLLGEATSEQSITAIDNELAKKYGFYEIPDKEIADFHTLSVEVPTLLFSDLDEWHAGKRDRPPLQVTVRCVSRTQYLGVAKYDFYVLDSTRGFEQNFFKATAGLWFRICLIVGIAVTCSTFLSGIISFLTTLCVYLVGTLLPFARTIAAGQTIGGGSFENAFRLFTGAHTSMPLDQSPLVTVVQNVDKVFAWVLGGFLRAIPDVARYDLTRFVEDGFNISGSQLVLTGLMLVGYLLPWIVLSFYLMCAREVAS